MKLRSDPESPSLGVTSREDHPGKLGPIIGGLVYGVGNMAHMELLHTQSHYGNYVAFRNESLGKEEGDESCTTL